MTRADDAARCRPAGDGAATSAEPAQRPPRPASIKRRWSLHVMSMGRRLRIVEERRDPRSATDR
jgi:hypothetical protein